MQRTVKTSSRRQPVRNGSYLFRAIIYGIQAANRARIAEAKARGVDADQVELVPHWHPHQLRHNAATALRREHGIEVARIILGHRSAAITEVYAEVDHARAIDVMAKIGYKNLKLLGSRLQLARLAIVVGCTTPKAIAGRPGFEM